MVRWGPGWGPGQAQDADAWLSAGLSAQTCLLVTPPPKECRGALRLPRIPGWPGACSSLSRGVDSLAHMQVTSGDSLWRPQSLGCLSPRCCKPWLSLIYCKLFGKASLIKI